MEAPAADKMQLAVPECRKWPLRILFFFWGNMPPDPASSLLSLPRSVLHPLQHLWPPAPHIINFTLPMYNYRTPAERMKSISSFNSVDKQHNCSRVSFLGTYKVKDGLPLNPEGRTGLCGRGLLGRWGPNHAGDPVVTRFVKCYILSFFYMLLPCKLNCFWYYFYSPSWID